MNTNSLSEALSPDKDKVHDQTPSIAVYGGGFAMSAARHIGNPTGKGGGIRGTIKGWSKASRTRMRRYLLTHRPVSGESYGMTLTIPGPEVAVEKAHEAFKKFSRRLVKLQVGAVWRIEIQGRGQLHWHMLVSIPECSDGIATRELRNIWEDEVRRLGWVGVPYEAEKHAKLLRVLDEGPEYELTTEEGEEGDLVETLWLCNRLLLPGANRHCVHVEKNQGEGKWLRYLQDHTTKSKQEQIPVGIGRHWGVVGRQAFEEVLPEEVYELTNKEYARVVRWMQRLATPRIKDSRAPFGRRAGYPIRRGRWGTSTWFSSGETVQRMIRHAKSLNVLLETNGAEMLSESALDSWLDSTTRADT